MDDCDEFGDAIAFRGSLVINVLYEIFAIVLLVFVPHELLSSTSTYHQVLGAISIPVFLWFFAMTTCNLYCGRRVMVAVGERGVFDWRISNAWIPWSAITEIDEAFPISRLGWRRYGFALKVDPAFLATFPEKKLSRLGRILNKRFGYVSLGVSLVAVQANFAKARAALERYCPHWQQIATDNFRK